MLKLLVLYGSYRSDRAGMRLVQYSLRRLRGIGLDVEVVDAKDVGLPMLDRMYKEYPADGAPPAMSALAGRIARADAFLFVVGEYNWGVQPGLKNLVDHYQEEWHWRPAALATYSAGRFAGVRGGCAWRPVLAELGMIVVPGTVAVGPITSVLDAEGHPIGQAGEALDHNFGRFADELVWWATASKEQRARQPPPY